jgi:hypothetical protein
VSFDFPLGSIPKTIIAIKFTVGINSVSANQGLIPISLQRLCVTANIIYNIPANNASIQDPTMNLNTKKLGIKRKIDVSDPKKVNTK